MSDKQANMALRYVMRLLPVLAGTTVSGARLCDLARAVNVSSVNAYRYLKVMEEEGFVQRMPGADERWVLAPKIVQIAMAFGSDVARAETRLREVKLNYSREPS